MSLNALKHGSHSRRLAASMRKLGENPAEYRRLLAELLHSHRPATLSEAMLVEDLAALRWQRRRCERALAGKLAMKVEMFRREQLQRLLDIRRRPFRAPEAPPGSGLRSAPDSSSKFSGLRDLLCRLVERIEAEDFSEHTRAALQAVFGDQPAGRGAHIVKLFGELAQPGPDTPLRRATVAVLGIALSEEARDVELEHELHLSEIGAAPPAARDACLAPSQDGTRDVIRQQAAIDRQIERKIKLLLQFEREREGRRRRELASSERAPKR